MTSRALVGLAGLGVGVALGLWTVRRRRSAPADPPGCTRLRGGSGLGTRLRSAIAEGREAAAATEAELRAQFGVVAADPRSSRNHGGGRQSRQSLPSPSTTDPVT